MYSSGGNNQWVHSNNASSALTLQEIADTMNLTRERVRQIEAKAIRKLRQKMTELNIKPKDLYCEFQLSARHTNIQKIHENKYDKS